MTGEIVPLRNQPRQPPHDEAAEESVLGAMLLTPSAIDAVVDRVAPEDFYRPAHGHIFAAVVELHARGVAADAITVNDELARTGLLDSVGGPAILNHLQSVTPSTSNASAYARVVRAHALMRALIGVAGEIAEMGYAGGDVEQAIDRAEQMVYEVADHQMADDTTVLADLFHAALERIQRRYDGEIIPAVRTGLADYDDITGGVAAGSLNIVAARPGMGKTHMAAHLAAHVAQTGRPVLLISAEMSAEQVTERLLASASNIGLDTIRSARFAEGHWPKLTEGVRVYGGLPVYVRSSGSITVASIRSQVRRMRASLGVVPMVIVDYLQLLTGSRKMENRQTEVADYARGLKHLALDMATEVWAMAQVNRNVENRGDKRPGLADLRESGEIEAAADTVTFLYRDAIYNPNTPDTNVAELIVGKNRHGRVGTARVVYVPETGRYFDLARRF